MVRVAFHSMGATDLRPRTEWGKVGCADGHMSQVSGFVPTVSYP